MNNFNKKIIEKIKKGKIKQEAKWLVLTKKYSLWLTFIINTIISALAFTFFLRTITDSFGKMHEFKVANSFFLSNIFWIWFLSFIFFNLISIWNFKHTKNGWKYENYKIILISISISIIFGLGFYFHKIDHMVKKHFNCQCKKDHYCLEKNKK